MISFCRTHKVFWRTSVTKHHWTSLTSTVWRQNQRHFSKYYVVFHRKNKVNLLRANYLFKISVNQGLNLRVYLLNGSIIVKNVLSQTNLQHFSQIIEPFLKVLKAVNLKCLITYVYLSFWCDNQNVFYLFSMNWQELDASNTWVINPVLVSGVTSFKEAAKLLRGEAILGLFVHREAEKWYFLIIDYNPHEISSFLFESCWLAAS